ncbi:MAG TPA: hypothetical protein VN755_13345, partial [Steroidobacteraceae bacterium]|nr:hypothetical protein [Steroidobacteraceae bacterium]
MTRETIRLVGELTLATSATAAATLLLHVLGALTGALIFLLLPGRELLQPLQRFINLLLRLLLFPALNLLVLVPHLVGLELEEIGKILGVGRTTAATTTAATAHADLHIAIDRLGALEVLQRALLRRERLLRVALGELLFSSLHLLGCLLQVLRDHLEQCVSLRNRRPIHASRQFINLLAQPTLAQVNGRHVFAERARLSLFAVAFGLECRRHDIALLLGERARVLAATATTSTASLLVLPVITAERADGHEVDVGRCLLSPLGAPAIRGAREIGNHVARLQAEFL